MLLYGFYNYENVGDILLCRQSNDQTEYFKREDDVCYLYNKKDQLIGLNIFNASKYFGVLTSGQIVIDNQKINIIQELIKSYTDVCFEADCTEHIIVGKVVEIKEHPDSDHLHVCQVDLGDEVTQIVCGAPNVALNQKVVVATVGTMMPNGLLIVPSKLRKVDSNGMLCSARELDLPNEPQVRGIMVLDDDYIVGQPFFKQYEKGGN